MEGLGTGLGDDGGFRSCGLSQGREARMGHVSTRHWGRINNQQQVRGVGPAEDVSPGSSHRVSKRTAAPAGRTLKSVAIQSSLGRHVYVCKRGNSAEKQTRLYQSTENLQ